MKAEAEEAERRIKQANATERRAHSKVQDIMNACGMRTDPHSASSSLLKVLSSKGFLDE